MRMSCFSILATMVMLCMAPLATTAAETVLVADGQARAVICVAPDVLAAEGTFEKPGINQLDAETLRVRLKDSALDLAGILERMTGAKVEVIAGLPAANDKRVPILIGSLAEAKFGPAGEPAPHGQRSRVVVTGDAVGLYGESDLGSSYAVYTLLRELGCRWYMPGELGEVLPKNPTLALAPRDYNTAPYTEYRGIWFCDGLYAMRNRMGGLAISAGHALEGYISKEQREQHPEWIGLHDGKPSHRRLKWSAPGVADAIANELLARLDKDPNIASISLSPDDGLGYDNTEEERALDAGDFDPSAGEISITDRQIWFCNQIVEKVTAKYPDVLFGMLAYGLSTRPPVREMPHPNLIPQIAPITYTRAHPLTDDREPNNKAFRMLLQGWGKVAPRTSIYLYGWLLADPASPNPFMTKWGVHLPYIYKHANCRYWQPETLANFESTMHALYLGVQYAWDPTIKPQELFDELHAKFYGSAGEAMAAYWNFVDQTWVESPEISGAAFGHLQRWPESKIQKARALMNAGIAAAATDMEKARVKLADESLRLFEMFLKMRRDFEAGRWADLATEGKAYQDHINALSLVYADNYTFGKMPWTRDNSLYGRYFQSFYGRSHDDAARIANEATLLTGALSDLAYRFDPEKQGETGRWFDPAYSASDWKTANVVEDTFSTLGQHNYLGTVWYRTEVKLKAAPEGKRIKLWIGSTDGSVVPYVNGRRIAYVNAKGETQDEPFSGYCRPVSFDITDALGRAEEFQLTLQAERQFINELGTGGVMGPVAVYAE